MSPRGRWSDLPPELLAVLSGRLHDAADFVRFHAVCKLWRESLPQSTAVRPIFFPWLVAAPSGRDMKLRCVFSKTSYRAVSPARFSMHNWVARADGTAAWFFSALPEPRLVNPLTGEEKALPSFPGRGMNKNSRGVLYGDGTVFLYNFSEPDLVHKDDDRIEKTEAGLVMMTSPFTAAILRPGDTAWKLVKTHLDMFMDWEEFQSNHFLATYRVHDGTTLFHVDRDPWHLLSPPAGESEENFGKILEGEVLQDGDWLVDSSHVLESGGELLRVSVLIQRGEYHGFPWKRGAYQARVLSVSVHGLEEELDAKGGHRVRWARRDGRSFTDRVMFLGYPTSFAVEASRFRDGKDGGCVYFIQRRSEDLRAVFRYNLVDGKAKFLGRLPPEWYHRKNEAFLWLLPQPSIAPIKVIRERLEPLKTGDLTRKISTVRMEKPPTHYKTPFISFVVWNLPPGVDSSRLCCFFNKYGKVSDAEVTSPGEGFVTMAMATSSEQYEAEDVLDELVLDGYTLEVSKTTMAARQSCVASSHGAVTTI